MNKKNKINNFIGIYDNYIRNEDCDKVIKLYNQENKLKRTLNRQVFESADVLDKMDNQFFCAKENLDVWIKDMKPLLFNFDIALKNYETQTGIKKAYNVDGFEYTSLKIQKTLPTEGYHVWHVEHGSILDLSQRVLAYTIYLNNVKEGGETEFLNQSIRVKPKKGRIVIWPSAFPYVHRGNPPLSGEKYIITSWLKFK